VLIPLAGWMQADSIWLNLAAVVPPTRAGDGATALIGLAFERRADRAGLWPALEADLITMGGMIDRRATGFTRSSDRSKIALPSRQAWRGSFLIGRRRSRNYRSLPCWSG